MTPMFKSVESTSPGVCMAGPGGGGAEGVGGVAEGGAGQLGRAAVGRAGGPAEDAGVAEAVAAAGGAVVVEAADEAGAGGEVGPKGFPMAPELLAWSARRAAVGRPI